MSVFSLLLSKNGMRGKSRQLFYVLAHLLQTMCTWLVLNVSTACQNVLDLSIGEHQVSFYLSFMLLLNDTEYKLLFHLNKA